MLLAVSVHPTFSFPHPCHVHKSLLYESPFLPCKQVHQYHLSRFYAHALTYNICFSPFDLLSIIGSRFIGCIFCDTSSQVSSLHLLSSRTKIRQWCWVPMSTCCRERWLCRVLSESWIEMSFIGPFIPSPNMTGHHLQWHREFLFWKVTLLLTRDCSAD